MAFDYDVFLSHSAADKRVAQNLARRLRRKGLTVTWDKRKLERARSFVSFKINSAVYGLAVMPDGKRAAYGMGRGSILYTFDLESGQHLQRFIGHTASTTAVAVTPDGKRMVSSSTDETLKVWDLEYGPAGRGRRKDPAAGDAANLPRPLALRPRRDGRGHAVGLSLLLQTRPARGSGETARHRQL